MRNLILSAPPRRTPLAVARTSRPALRAQRPQLVRPVVDRSEQPTNGFDTDPYVDYGRYFTKQGGILFVYKDIDDSGRHSLWRFIAWASFTCFEVWFTLTRAHIETDWIRYTLCGLAVLVNWIIVAKPVEIFRRLEVRPDCLILDGEQIFWMNLMESLPSFNPDEGGNVVLTGIYGTRFVEYLTVRRFDEFDRTPQVMAGGFADALQQLWSNRP